LKPAARVADGLLREGVADTMKARLKVGRKNDEGRLSMDAGGIGHAVFKFLAF
jgi:hypothetical protein